MGEIGHSRSRLPKESDNPARGLSIQRCIVAQKEGALALKHPFPEDRIGQEGPEQEEKILLSARPNSRAILRRMEGTVGILAAQEDDRTVQ